MSEFDVDLFVIGAGSGGVRAARIASGHGARVMIAEEYRVGGTCVIRGCVPKKLLVYGSRFAEEFEDSVGFGWTVGEPRFDWKTLIANKDREIDRLNAAYIRNLERAGVEIVNSRAVVVDPHTVEIAADGRRITAKTILIATGAAPFIDPALDGREHAITSNEAFYLEKLPERIVLVGGGYISIEFAGIFNGLGVDTTILHRGEALLRGFDDELRHTLRAEIEKKGVRVITGDTPKRIEKRGDGFIVHTANGAELPADLVMVATGRKPNTSGIGLEAAGVALDGAGAITVDAYSQSNVPSIYAVGDVTNRVALTPVAIREGHAFADTVFGGKKVAVDYFGIPKAVFAQPELATVGLTEEEAVREFASVDVYKTTFKPMKHTLSGRDEKMMMKLLVDADTDRVLGCHVLGSEAAEIIQMVAIALKLRATKSDFDDTMALHPSASEELVTMRTPSEKRRRAAA